jgi:uncharacterized protein YdaU (DUF1376 family)
VNYFELHVGDYQRKTAHLSLAEHGAYSLMLQAFYATEKPLPENRKILYRMLRVDSARERKAVDSVCDQFWQYTEGGLTNKRAEQVLAAYHNWLAKQKANGSQGGRPPKPKDNPPLTDGLPLGFSGDNPNETHGVTQTKPNGGYRARVPLPTSHLDHDLDRLPTPTPPKGGDGRHRRSPARAEKDAALEVWNQLVASSGALPPRDHKLQAAIDAVGGWSRIAQREQGIDAQRVQRDFVEAYRSGS